MKEKLELGKEMLFLSEQDIKKVLDVKTAIPLCEEAERLTGLGEGSDDKFYLPVKGDLTFKPFAGYLKSKKIVASKIFTLAKDNPKIGLPASTSIGLIYDAETLVPLAVVDANWLTGVKVGASSSVAAKYLCKKNSSIVTIIGAGLQGRTHLEGLNELFKIKEARIADIIKESRERYANEMNKKLKINVIPVDTIKEAVKDSDIVVTVTTADEPLIKKEWVKPGMTVLKLGSYQELDLDLVNSVDKFVVDKWEFVSHRSKEIVTLLKSGKISQKNVYSEICDIVAGKKVGRKTNDESILFVALGLGGDYVTIFDHVYNKALELGIGQKLKIFG